MAVDPISAILVVLALFVILALPVILVLVSKRTDASAIYIWFVATLMLSWVGYGLFLLRTEKRAIPH